MQPVIIRLIALVVIAVVVLQIVKLLAGYTEVVDVAFLAVMFSVALWFVVYAERYQTRELGMPKSRRRVVLLVIGAVGGFFLFIITWGAFVLVFGGVGFVFAMMVPLGIFAVYLFVDGLRKRQHNA
jgi:hypothetical protein